MVAISSVTSSPSTVTLPISGSSHASAQPASTKSASVQVKAQPSTPNNAQPKNQEQAVTEHQVQQAVSEANLAFSGNNESVAFSYEKKLGLLFVQVTDNQSGEVIREIPSKDFIKHHLAMHEMVGLILDKEA
jgi:flagellar protein FlaG